MIYKVLSCRDGKGRKVASCSTDVACHVARHVWTRLPLQQAIAQIVSKELTMLAGQRYTRGFPSWLPLSRCNSPCS